MYLTKHSKQKDYSEQIIQCIRRMQARGIKANAATIILSFEGLAKYRPVSKVLELWEWMKQTDFAAGKIGLSRIYATFLNLAVERKEYKTCNQILEL